MATINPWINFNGNAEEVFMFYKSVGGEVEGSMGDGPYGSYMGMFRDKYGIEWIIEFSSNQ